MKDKYRITKSTIIRLAPIIAVLVILAFIAARGCDRKTSAKGATGEMKTYYIGRFSIDMPADMEMTARTGKLRYVDIDEVIWQNDVSSEKARMAEWDQFMANVKEIRPPKGKEKVIIRTYDFPEIGKWVKGIFYYIDRHDDEYAPWTLLMDMGRIGIWLKSDSTEIEDENLTNRVLRNLIEIAKSYLPLDMKTIKNQITDSRFFLKHGAINLPYSANEESMARFDNHELDLNILIEMNMDIAEKIETEELIERTEKLLASDLIPSTGGISKIRLQKREVAGMLGDETLLELRDGKERSLVFTWEYNGKYDSGEYPVTKIEMECPTTEKLEEKIRIWDAVLDSMKPLFERKK